MQQDEWMDLRHQEKRKEGKIREEHHNRTGAQREDMRPIMIVL
jgi:hypothetical protein